MSDIGVTFMILGSVIVLFVSNRIPAVIVALGTPLALFLAGILDLRGALSGFGDPIVVFIASLFVVSGGLQAAGVTAWAGQALAKRAGTSQTRLVIMIMLLCAVVSALIGFIGAVAALLPVVVAIAGRLGRPASSLLMPLAFASSAGGLLTLTGSPVNMITYEAAQNAGVGAFGFFEFAIAGVPLLIGIMVIVLLLGKRLIPERVGDTLPEDLRAHSQTLVEQFQLTDGLHRLRVRATSSYIGACRADIDLSRYPGLILIAAKNAVGQLGPLSPAIAEGDELLVRGDALTLGRLAADKHLAFRPDDGPEAVADQLLNRNFGLAEVLIPPRSKLVGTTVFAGMVTSDGNLMILAVQRGGADLESQPIVLAVGDHMLLQGTWQALDEKLGDPQVLLVDSPEVIRQQALALGPGAVLAIAVLVVLVALLASAVVPSAIAALGCACAMILLRVLTLPQAFKAIDGSTAILIAGMIPLSTAMTQTGAANLMAEQLLAIVGSSGPYALLAGLFLLTCTLGQMVSNTATAHMVVPIGLAAAIDIGTAPTTVLMSITVAAGASFLTPVATPGNLMVMGPGGYRFGDYWKLGLPSTLWFLVVAVFIVPLYWRL